MTTFYRRIDETQLIYFSVTYCRNKTSRSYMPPLLSKFRAVVKKLTSMEAGYSLPSEISAAHSGEYEDDSFLGYFIVQSCLSTPTFQRYVVRPSSGPSWPWWWTQYTRLKRRCATTNLQGVISHSVPYWHVPATGPYNEFLPHNSQLIYLRSILILSSHLYLCFKRGIFPEGIWYNIYFSNVCCILLVFMTVETLVQAPDRSFPYRPIN
jgi:hypothetical protein